MKDKFFTKQGWLSFYAMACGYRHETERGNYHVSLAMNNPELNTFDVIVMGDIVRVSWDTVEGIREARALYRAKVREHCQGLPARREKKSYEPVTMPACVYA